MPRGSEALTNARKEEIFLALLKREYEAWITDMEALIQRNSSMDALGFSEEMAKILEKFFSSMTEQDRKGFLYAFFPFLFGIHPRRSAVTRFHWMDTTRFIWVTPSGTDRPHQIEIPRHQHGGFSGSRLFPVYTG